MISFLLCLHALKGLGTGVGDILEKQSQTKTLQRNEDGADPRLHTSYKQTQFKTY